jgi:predicted cobalt transporter CbtA
MSLMRSYIRVGVVAGVVVGLLFAVYASLIFLPLMEQAEVYEHHATNSVESHAHSGSQPLIGAIAGVEMMTIVGNLAWVVTLGVLTAVGFYFAEPMLESFGRHTRGLLVGLAGFVAVRVVPWTVYRPVSPAAELALSRPVYIPWYWATVGITGLTFLSVPFVYRYLRQTYERRTARLGVAALGLIPMAAVIITPTNTVISAGAPLEFHYQYIAAVVGGQLAVWVSLGLLIGHFAGIKISKEQSANPTRSPG